MHPFNVSQLHTCCLLTYYFGFWFLLNILWRSILLMQSPNVNSALHTGHAKPYDLLTMQHLFHWTRSVTIEQSQSQSGLIQDVGRHPAVLRQRYSNMMLTTIVSQLVLLACAVWLLRYQRHCFQSYFCERTQSFVYASHATDCFPVTYGVPQASIFGPIGFNAYTEDLTVMSKKHSVHSHMYADDAQLYDISRLADADYDSVPNKAPWICDCACCLRMMRAGSCIVFLCNLVTMSGPRASCAVLFLPSYLMGLSCMYVYIYN